jgi:hypothetical protein
MTEQQWLTGIDPVAVREFLRAGASKRKLRLHGAACCRRVWHLLADSRSRFAVEVAERLADGEASEAEARAAGGAAYKASRRDPDDLLYHDNAACAATVVCQTEAWRAAEAAASYAAFALADDSGGDRTEAEAAAAADYALATGSGGDRTEEALAAAASALRLRRLDIFGNPFRPVNVSSSWLTPDVLTLAQAAYDDRTLPAGTLEPTRLALLADALEEAGCDNAEILGHLRGEGPHVRGCWVVDLLLGKS